MKILVLNYEYPPIGAGAAPVCRDLAAGMAAEGQRVTVVTMGYRGLPERQQENGVEIIRLDCLRKHEHSCSPVEQLSFIIKAQSFLEKHLKTHSYDICHTHFIFPDGPIALWLKTRHGMPYVLTAHGSDVEGHNTRVSMRVMHRILRPAWKKIVSSAYAVAAPSSHLIRLMNDVMRSRRYVIIPNGLDIKKYKFEWTDKEKRILVMGRMQKFKNVQTILTAISLINQDAWDGWHVDILGDGPYREELERLAINLNITERATFHGWIDNGSEEQLAYLKRASIYVSASYFENCPMSVLEAIASGCYPLLSDIEGHRQFFGNKRNQFFFKVDDVEELSKMLQELLKKDLLLNMPDIDIAGFDNSMVCRLYIQLLEKSVNNGKTR